MGFIIEYRGIFFDSLGVEHLHGNPAVLSPADETSGTWDSLGATMVHRNLPCITIRRRGNGEATEDRLTLHEIWLATGEDCTVGDQQVLGNACIRDDNKELIAHPERKEWPVNLRPVPQNALRIRANGSATKQWAWGNRVAIFVFEVSPEDGGYD